jgi:hypothetical protein
MSDEGRVTKDEGSVTSDQSLTKLGMVSAARFPCHVSFVTLPR